MFTDIILMHALFKLEHTELLFSASESEGKK